MMTMRTLLLLLVSLFSSSIPSASAADSSILSSSENETVFSLLSTSSSFNILAKLLNDTNVGPSTNKIGRVYTLLAPTDDILTQLSLPYVNYLNSDATTVANLSSATNAWNYHAAALAQFHVVPSEILNVSDIFDTTTSSNTNTSLPTLLNESIAVHRSTNTLGNTNASITQADILAFNGVVQIIDQVLIPDSLYNTTVASAFANDLASNFTIFASLLAQAESYGQANGVGSLLGDLSNVTNEFGITLLVPTDATLEPVLTGVDVSDALAYFLVTYHIAGQNINPAPSSEAQAFYAYNDVAAWYHTTSDGKPAINTVNITKTHLAGNGIINIVDFPLIPLDVGSQLQIASKVGGPNLTDFYGFVNANIPQFWDLTLNPDFWTIFAVPDEVLQSDATSLILTRLIKDVWKVHLLNVVEHHLYKGSLTVVPDVTSGAEVAITMASGFNTSIQILGDSLIVGGYPCYFVGLTAYNGDIDGLSTLLLPPWYYVSIYELVNDSDNFSTAIELIQRGNLTYLLNETDGPLTFIVPDNDAFAAVGNLSSYSDDEVRQILMGHVFADNIFTQDLAGQTSGNGVFDRWTVTTSSDGKVSLNGGLLYVTNNLAYNGVVHGINKVLIEATTAPTAPTGTPPTAPSSSSSSGTTPTAPTPTAPVSTPGATNGATSAAAPRSSTSSIMGRATMVLSLMGMWLLAMV